MIGIVVLAIARPRSPDTVEGFETKAVADGMYTLYAKDGELLLKPASDLHQRYMDKFEGVKQAIADAPSKHRYEPSKIRVTRRWRASGRTW